MYLSKFDLEITTLKKIYICIIAALLIAITSCLGSIHFDRNAEMNKLEELVLTFLSTKEKDFQSEAHLNLAEFFIPDVRDSLETQLSWKVFRFEKLVRYSICQNILWETFDANVAEIILDGDLATVKAYEYYEYELSTADGIISSRGSLYTFNCQKIDEDWFIVSIETNKSDIEGLVEDIPADLLPELAGVS